MDPDRWDRLKAAFEDAIAWGEGPGPVGRMALDRGVRPTGDPDIDADLESLLRADAEAGDWLESPLWRDADLADGAWWNGFSEGAAQPVRVGQSIGAYRVVSLLGRGGMGEVYLAEQSQPTRLVAIKLLRADAAGERAALRLRREAELLARLDHPGIGRLIEVGTHDDDEDEPGRPYLVLEYVEGLPVTEAAREHGLSHEDRLGLIVQACDAVEHAHRRGVIHRDLKPANVLLDGQGRIRILDFGIATLISREPAAEVTLPGFVPGTLAYMSPEQASADVHAIDTRSDVYALGVLLYELLVGRLPVASEGRSFIEFLQAIRESRPIPPTQAVPALRSLGGAPGDIDRILAAALAKRPDDRYPSAGALGDDLRRLLGREPLAVRAPGLGYLLRVALRRRCREVLVGVAAFAVGLTAAVWFFAQSVRAEHLAAQRLAEVRRTAAELVTDLSRNVWTFSTAAEARAYLAREASVRLERIIREAGEDPETLDAVAEAYGQLGLSIGHPGVDNLGRRDEARDWLARSMAIRRRLLAAMPNSAPMHEKASQAAARLAPLLPMPEDSVALMREAVVFGERAAALAPGDLVLRGNLAYRYLILASLERRAGHPWRHWTDRALAVYGELIRAEPAKVAWLQNLGVVQSELGLMLFETDRAAAVESLRAACDTMSRALAVNPSEYTNIRHLSRAECFLARHALSVNQPEDARTLVNHAAARLAPLLPNAPSNSMYRLDYTDTQLAAAEVHIGLGEAMAGRASLDRALEVLLNGRDRGAITLPEERLRLDAIDRTRKLCDGIGKE